MENQRLAVNTGVILSGNLISACLSMIAIIGALLLFVIEKRDIGWVFYLLISLSFLAFIYSIILGGKGINIAREKASQDILDLNFTESKFNYQAIFCILGIIFCILSIAFTKEKEEKNLEFEKLNNSLIEFLKVEKDKQSENEKLLQKIIALENRINQLEKTQQTPPNPH